jgi:membrane protein involved in colicin uptake
VGARRWPAKENIMTVTARLVLKRAAWAKALVTSIVPIAYGQGNAGAVFGAFGNIMNQAIQQQQQQQQQQLYYQQQQQQQQRLQQQQLDLQRQHEMNRQYQIQREQAQEQQESGRQPNESGQTHRGGREAP